MQVTKKRAFTLMELMVVIAIIAMLAALAIPQYRQARRRAEWSQAWPVLDAAYKAELVYYQEYDAWAIPDEGENVVCSVGDGETIDLFGIAEVSSQALYNFCYGVSGDEENPYLWACRKLTAERTDCGEDNWGIKKWVVSADTETNPDPACYP